MKRRKCDLVKVVDKKRSDAMKIVEKTLIDNPYPRDIFLPLRKKDLDNANLALKEWGISLDRLAGNMMRRAWHNCCVEILSRLEKEGGDGKG